VINPVIAARLTGIIGPDSAMPPVDRHVTPEQLLKEADRCVKCGLCLPHCPTYLHWENEADSPRGRISLIQALAAGELHQSRGLERHLDRCLSCLACEAACPSGVKYGELIDGGRTLLNQTQHKRLRLRALFDLFSNRERLDRWRSLYRQLRRLRLTGLARLLPLPSWRRMAMLGQQLSAEPGQLTGLYPARFPSGRLLQLFIGCVGSQTEQRLIRETVVLLSRLGFAVEIPEAQTCCGAMHRHNGFPAQAEDLCAINQSQLKRSRAEKLITLASACQLELSKTLDAPMPIIGLVDFLLELSSQSPPPLKPLHRRVALHIPCSSQRDASRQLLEQIPAIDLIELPENSLCCGAAGTYLLTQPAASAALGDAKLAHLRASGASLLVTSNTGCAMQFRDKIREAGLAIEVLHPGQLYARQLDA
jgi:glycolate oxidase iron-sulfur subunit